MLLGSANKLIMENYLKSSANGVMSIFLEQFSLVVHWSIPNVQIRHTPGGFDLLMAVSNLWGLRHLFWTLHWNAIIHCYPCQYGALRYKQHSSFWMALLDAMVLSESIPTSSTTSTTTTPPPNVFMQLLARGGSSRLHCSLNVFADLFSRSVNVVIAMMDFECLPARY